MIDDRYPLEGHERRPVRESTAPPNTMYSTVCFRHRMAETGVHSALIFRKLAWH